MGNDGGSIPRRRELVKESARLPSVSELKATALESLAHAWENDPISSDPVELENAVSDWRGRLYNYETILKGLMPGDESEANGPEAEAGDVTFASTGIRSLRDVVKLKFKRYAPAGSQSKAIWACPVSLKEMGPATKAVYLVPCGHVFAEMAVKQIQEHVCPECSESFDDRNVIPILPTEKAELERLRQRLEDLKTEGLTHSLKKDKSNGKKKRKVEEANGEDAGGKQQEKEKEKERGKSGKKDIAGRLSGINNAMTASLTAKVLAEQDERNKRRKLAAAR